MTLRLTLATVTIVCLSLVPSIASEPEDTYEELVKCSGITDAATRLACFDKQMPRVRAALAKGPEELSHEDQTSLFGLTLPNIFGSSEATTPQQFGANDLPAPEPAPGATSVHALDSITATVTDYAMTPHGKFIVFLDNGQVWRQQESDSGNAHFKPTPGDNKVLISTGSLGSYTLQLNGGNKVFKVNRVK